MKCLIRIAIFFVFLGAALPQANASEVKVFAAASLTDAMQAIATIYESKSGDKIVFNFAGSNVLARQIIAGAPADLFVSADETQMDTVAKSGLLVNNSRRDILSNTLVVILPGDSNLAVRGVSDLTKAVFKRIALGDPETVPIGVYAKKYLEGKGIWDALQGKIVPTGNVRDALAAVASGNVDAGIVYKTDAIISKKIRVAFEIPATDGPQILYPLALIRDSKASGAARKFLEFLESPQAATLFAHYGFLAVR